jgi:hypothetical protein
MDETTPLVTREDGDASQRTTLFVGRVSFSCGIGANSGGVEKRISLHQTLIHFGGATRACGYFKGRSDC